MNHVLSSVRDEGACNDDQHSRRRTIPEQRWRALVWRRYLPVQGGESRDALAQDPTPGADALLRISLGEGGMEITMWVQDFGPAIEYFRKAAEAYIARGTDVNVTVQAIAYNDLLAKMLPSVAAGNEADILMGYTDWYVATDVSASSSPSTSTWAAKPRSKKSLFPSSLTTLDLPEDKIYYVPWAAGIRGAARPSTSSFRRSRASTPPRSPPGKTWSPPVSS